MIQVSMPSLKSGEPYKECLTLTGTSPFTLVSHNVTNGKASIVGSSLCLEIQNPTSKIDFVAEVKGGCAACKTETIKSEIAFVSNEDPCPCVPVTLEAISAPPLNTGKYSATIKLKGTMPFSLCGVSAPKCINVALTGNLVSVTGQNDGSGDVTFSVKNACTCDCVTYTIPKAP